MGEPNFKWQVHASGLSLKIKNHGCHAIKDKTDKKHGCCAITEIKR